MSENKKDFINEKETQKEENLNVTQISKPKGVPGFNGILPHGTKKESLGPNTKR